MGVPGGAAGGGTRPRHPPHLLLQGVVATVTGIQRPLLLLLLRCPGALLQHRHPRLGESQGGHPKTGRWVALRWGGARKSPAAPHCEHQHLPELKQAPKAAQHHPPAKRGSTKQASSTPGCPCLHPKRSRRLCTRPRPLPGGTHPQHLDVLLRLRQLLLGRAQRAVQAALLHRQPQRVLLRLQLLPCQLRAQGAGTTRCFVTRLAPGHKTHACRRTPPLRSRAPVARSAFCAREMILLY